MPSTTTHAPPPNLGAFIRSKREEKKLSLRALADKVKIVPAHQSDIEHGRRYPSDEVLEKTAQVLNISMEEMQKNDSRVKKELNEWLKENHAVHELLREFQRTGRSGDELVVAWQKVVAKKR